MFLKLLSTEFQCISSQLRWIRHLLDADKKTNTGIFVLRLQMPRLALYKLPACLLLIYQISIWLYTLKFCSSAVIRERHQRTRALLVVHSRPGVSLGTQMFSLPPDLAKSQAKRGQNQWLFCECSFCCVAPRGREALQRSGQRRFSIPHSL